MRKLFLIASLVLASVGIGFAQTTPAAPTKAKTEKTARPAAGPLTWSGHPEIEPTTRPPMIPVMSPAPGGAPEAIAMPMHSGRATRNTTTDPNAS